jgi:hypothetical protein
MVPAATVFISHISDESGLAIAIRTRWCTIFSIWLKYLSLEAGAPLAQGLQARLFTAAAWKTRKKPSLWDR